MPVREPRHGPRLPLKAQGKGRVGIQRRSEDLDRNLAVKRNMDGLVHLGHAAAAEELEDLVFAEPGRRVHGRESTLLGSTSSWVATRRSTDAHCTKAGSSTQCPGTWTNTLTVDLDGRRFLDYPAEEEGAGKSETLDPFPAWFRS